MKIQLIKIAEQQDEALYKRLYSMAHEAKVGTVRDGKILFKIEEYLFLFKQLVEPKGIANEDMMQWQISFHQCASIVASKYNAVFLYE